MKNLYNITNKMLAFARHAKQHGWLTVLNWLLAIIGPYIAIYFMKFLSVPPDSNQSILIFIFLSAMMIWVLGLAAPLVSAIYLLLGTIFLSLAPYEITLSGFYSDTFFLLIALCILGSFIKTSGLNYRFSLMLYQFNTQSKMWKHFVMFISGAIITPVIPSANGRAFITCTLFDESKKLFNIKNGNLEYQKLVATTIGGFSLLSPIFLTSKSINLLAFGMLPEQVQQDFEFFYWLVAASLVGLILIVAHAFLVSLLFYNKLPHSINKTDLAKSKQALGKLSGPEILTIVGILLFATMILTKNIHQLNISWLALFILVFTPLMLGLLENKQFNKMVEWDFLVILAALIGFSQTMEYLHLNEFITYYLSDLTDLIERDFVAFVIYLSLITYALRLLIPINLVVIILCSTLIPVASETFVNPWVVVFIVLLMAETSTGKITTSYILVFFEFINDAKHYWRVALLQGLVHIVKIIATIASIPFWHYLGIL